MKKITYLTLIALTSICSACSDYLDVKPVGKLIPTEVTEFENLLNNTATLNYFMKDNNNGCFYAYMGDNLQLSENQANQNYISSFPNLDHLAGYIFYSPVMKPTSTHMCWSYGIYRPLGYFNNVIDGVTGIDAESEFAKGVIGQARAGRAWLLINTAITYGPMYDPNGANDAKVVPMRLSGDPTVANGDLATTAQLFEAAKADLDYACENCPTSLANPSRIDRACAYALRAEYYMYLRDWDNMLADSKKAWELTLANNDNKVGNLIYNFNDFYYEQVGEINPPAGCSPEYYMTLRGPDTKFEQTSSRENLLYRYCPVGASTSAHYPSDDWKALFDKESDLRWKLFLFVVPGYATTTGGVRYDDGNQEVYYRDAETLSTQGMTHPLLLLTMAEAEVRKGNLGAALSDLNTLRKYRYSGTDTNLKNGESMNQDELINEILKERRREQPLVSFQRTVDLKRYAFDSGKPWCKMTITHYIGEKSYSKSITDAYFQSLPIDNAIIQYNPQWGLTTNETEYAPYNAK